MSVNPRPLAESRRPWVAGGSGLAEGVGGLTGNFAGGAGAAGTAGMAAAAGDAKGSGVDEDGCVGSGAASAPLPSAPSARAFTGGRGGRWGRSRPRTSRALGGSLPKIPNKSWTTLPRFWPRSPTKSLFCR